MLQSYEPSLHQRTECVLSWFWCTSCFGYQQLSSSLCLALSFCHAHPSLVPPKFLPYCTHWLLVALSHKCLH